jgi:hypothetical protein
MSAGAKNGCQYCATVKSGDIAAILRAEPGQARGLQECRKASAALWSSREPVAPGSSCEVPGKRIGGYRYE